MTGLEIRLLGYALLAAALVGGWFYVGHLQDRAKAAEIRAWMLCSTTAAFRCAVCTCSRAAASCASKAWA